jgi:membrane-associated protease RseP (regulator of RpoE activity)
MTLAPPKAPPQPPPAARSAGALLRLGLTVAAVAALFFLVGLGDLFLVILAVVIMVMVHEAGHFVTAKWSRMKVTEFFVGFGPRLWSVRRGETDYGVKGIPAGGYVKIPGMTNLEEIDPADEARTYRQQPFHKRIIVASAGSFMHFVMAFILAWVTLVFVGAQTNSQLVIAAVTPFAGQHLNPAQRAGLQVGDVVVGVNGHSFTNPDQVTKAIQGSVDKPVRLEVQRNGVTRTLTVVPADKRDVVIGHQRQEKPTGRPTGFIGVEFGGVAVPENPFGALGGAGVVVGQTTSLAFTGLGQVFSPHGIAGYIHQVSDPTAAAQDARDNTPRPESIIGAVRTAVQGAQAGAGFLLEVLIALNIFIGIANMLPMLPLDGGHVAIAVYERIRTRRGRPYYQADAAKLVPVAYAFIALLILLVSSAAYLDITHPVANPFG